MNMVVAVLNAIVTLSLLWSGATNSPRIFATSMHSSTGRMVKAQNPPNCLEASPQIHLFEGRLAGIVHRVQRDTLAADRELAGRHGRFATLFLLLTHSISVCADPQNSEPAYVDVRRIAIGNFSYTDYKSIKMRWGNNTVRIRGGIGGSPTAYLPGPIRFWVLKEFCSRPERDNSNRAFNCLSWSSWIESVK